MMKAEIIITRENVYRGDLLGKGETKEEWHQMWSRLVGWLTGVPLLLRRHKVTEKIGRLREGG